jgi:hypothetical protein
VQPVGTLGTNNIFNHSNNFNNKFIFVIIYVYIFEKKKKSSFFYKFLLLNKELGFKYHLYQKSISVLTL